MKEVVYNFNGNAIYRANDDFKLNKSDVIELEKSKIYSFAGKSDKITFLDDAKFQKDTFFISENKRVLDNSKLSRLKEYFDHKVKYYSSEILGINVGLQLTNSWFTINKKGGQHHSHRHRNCFISIVFYPEIKEGDIEFSMEDNNLTQHMNMDFEYTKKTEYNSSFLRITPVKSDIIIFPGWLTHGTLPNPSDQDRIMIGANYWVKGTFGNDKNVNELVI